MFFSICKAVSSFIAAWLNSNEVCIYRVFYKVKSRSAHMKSHAEQERKAAAQSQREEEERAAKARQEMLEAARRKEAQRGGQEEVVELRKAQ